MDTKTKKAVFEDAYYLYAGYGFEDSWEAWKDALENNETAQIEWNVMSDAEQKRLLNEYDNFLDLASSKARGGLKAALAKSFGSKKQQEPKSKSKSRKQSPPASIRGIGGD